MPPLTVVAHPVVNDSLTRLRDVTTGRQEFRRLLGEVSLFLAIEATRALPTIDAEVTTPLTTCRAKRLGATPILSPILRAGLGFIPGFLQVVPEAMIAHLGFYRDPHTLAAVPYYANLPRSLSGRPVFVLDPMLATGNSACAALTLLHEHGADAVTFVSLLATQIGIDAIAEAYPTVHVITAAIDPTLDERGYIIPGLGDAGDRQFGTEHSAGPG